MWVMKIRRKLKFPQNVGVYSHSPPFSFKILTSKFIGITNSLMLSKYVSQFLRNYQMEITF
ncbi:hypothetical protein BVRB_8g186580 [Beta vulgaris subsp. vulgaris]|uniref:Uncharacterized protein n=1 Tax=Beta vulgaris subsp. vulgaris TaxID=3555 RepID=A0A0J8EM55_BETVV|nr:hypothetical protein BVRB_8g186580 [Beta vulgaris subsp. vulgaris]